MSKYTDVVAALIRRDDKFLICRRPVNKSCALLWEFVGGKVEPGETYAQALVRECREELGIEVQPGELFSEAVHEYSDITVRLYLFNTEIVKGEPQLLEHDEIKWVGADELGSYEFCPADIEILEKIKKNYQK